jgi:hypothetical protein
LVALIVWIEMLPEDSAADIPALAAELADRRIHWFHDPERRAGVAVGESLGAAGNVAWDIYLFFDAHVEWRERLPAPRQWAHQLSDVWADPTRHHSGDRLEPELSRLLKGMLSQ